MCQYAYTENKKVLQKVQKRKKGLTGYGIEPVYLHGIDKNIPHAHNFKIFLSSLYQ